MLLNPWILSLFQTIAMRMCMGFISSAIITYFLIVWALKKGYFRSKARALTPERHQLKNNVPTMGGLYIMASIVITALWWCGIYNAYLWLSILCMGGFAALGAWDDWLKIKTGTGILARTKWIGQLCISTIIIVAYLYITNGNTTIIIPFFEPWYLNSGIWFIIWGLLILLATSNAVNLTDGLDGLAVGSLIPVFSTLALLIYSTPNVYIQKEMMELSVLAFIIVGSLCAFLWFNKHPAQLFMGDVGSLSLGAGLACIALLTKQELLLPFLGIVFVIETASVILQVLSFKLCGKRLFKMAPIHHHFELMGWREPLIVFYFSCLSLIVCLMILFFILVSS